MQRPRRERRLLPRVEDNGRVLRQTYRVIAAAIREERAITPAAEWLVDNFHVVDEQLREIRDDLPPGFYRQLPKLAEGPLAGYPRVYGLAWAFVAHTDSRFDPEMLRRFVHAYQRVEPLMIGELWAVAITLRIVLVENLRRCAEEIVRARAARQEADALADDLLGVGDGAVTATGTALARFESAPLTTAFAVQLVQRLREQDRSLTPALLWLDQRLGAQGTTSDDIVRREHQGQAAMNVTVRNVIMSMSAISALDWAEFFESVSLVDGVLHAAPGYGAMDFATRDAYRHAVEDLARGSRRSELDVAHAAMAATGRARGPDDRAADPGFHLVGDGRSTFEPVLGYRAPPLRRLFPGSAASAALGYVGTIGLITAAIIAVPLLAASASGASPLSLLVLGLLALVPASDLAVVLLNRIVTALVTPIVLPRLELRDGVPSHLRTMIVVPTLLADRADIEEQIERLEVHYLANPDGDLRFAILSDWTDAGVASLPGDAATLETAREGIARLNARHGPAADGGERFLLFHRRRLWNASEGTWMGWERKRGKLHELNRLLRGATDTSYVPGPAAVPAGVRYVVTLDADTRLPRGAVERLVGAMAHPLNVPRFDDDGRRVVDGYAVLQPRVTPPLPGREGSFLQQLSSGPAGIDPYAAAVSDVYQDLWGEGSYTGKGIYDVDAFERALAGRVPENALLSHDLLEGVFARAGLVTDVELFESAPSHYGVACARQHRWARGDWQLLPWILGMRVPLIGRWKMLDNLRRTLSAPAAFLTLVAGWTLPGTSHALWSAFVLSTIALPPLVSVCGGLIPRRRGISKRSHVRAVVRDLGLAVSQIAITTTMLAYQAWLMSDAILRTLARVYVTRRRLLEWVTAAQAKAGLRLDFRGFCARMAGAVALAAAAGALVAWRRPDAWPAALPFLVLWAASPAVARWISVPRRVGRAGALSPADAEALRLIACRTWRYFSMFVGPDDHALPPDNFQETPRPVVAHRTSPTNIGLYLLSAVAARDFGWLGTLDTVERLDATLETMTTLDRFHGHFYNWYDTQDCRALEPKYVSSVDSGNLAGHLIAIAHACEEMIERPAHRRAALSGIEDVARLVRLAMPPASGGAGSATRTRLAAALADVLAAVRAPASAPEWPGRLALLRTHARTVVESAWALLADDPRGEPADLLVWAEALGATVDSHLRDLDATAALAVRLAALARRAQAFVDAMDFGFLFDPVRKLLAIGYRVADGSLDSGRYDLLASEARLASFVAIAKGDVPVSHWFRLGRAVTPVEQDSVLVSWSGSMFEYLMPALVMRAPAGSLLEQTSRLVVGRQISYGAERGVPWGVSESAYNVRDLEMTYQYSNFGVPGIGLRRGLSEDVVIAPYATGLAAMVDGTAATRNFARLAAAGGRGPYGFYEALDYTAGRLPEGENLAVVQAYMAHHQGMLIVALANALHDGAMRARFHADPLVRATELLLQERTPRDVAVARPRAEEVEGLGDVREFVAPVERHFTSPHGSMPRTHVLSNGRYAVMLTTAGSGHSRWRDLAITRWREDVTRDAWGTYVFLRDVDTGETWSAGYQPCGGEPSRYEVTFSEDRAEIVRRDRAIGTTLQIIVSSEDDAEVRRVSLTNFGARSREIEVTSYAEVVLAPPAADVAHPAFSNLSVETECVPELATLLATRRPRSRGETPVWLAHVAVVDGETVGELQWETDRARFVGRGQGIGAPTAVMDGGRLSGTVGAVLDPVVSLRRRVRVAAGATVRVAFSTLVAPSRAAALDLAEKYGDAATFERAATLAWTQAQVQLHHLGIGPDEALLFQSLASRILYSDRALRPAGDMLAGHTGRPDGLWAHGISGDRPIVLVQIDEPEDVGIVRQLLRAHEYWRLKQLPVDLVIVNERAASYVQDLQSLLETLLRTSQSASGQDHAGMQGHVYIVRADRLSPPQRDALHSAARAVLSSRRGTLGEQMARAHRPEAAPLPSPPRRRPPRTTPPAPASPAGALELWNGLGGFDRNGREYVTILAEGRSTPAPWINVIANPRFGFQVSESGSGFTWSINSRERQLTAWSNDPVSDPPGETLYVRDEDTGEIWGPTALPIREDTSPYVIRHGQGYSRFEHVSHGVSLELVQLVPLDDSVKISRLTLTNVSARARRLSVTAYVEWVLGASRAASAPFVVTEIDGATGAMLVRNRWSSEFGARVAFADLGGTQTSWTADRTEFIGRNGSLEHPAGLARRDKLSGRVGAGLDPCSVLQTMVELPAGGRADVVLFVGDAASAEEARAMIVRYRTQDVAAILRAVGERWDAVLGAVQVTTPDRSMDLLLNRWLLYQTQACRLWSRSAFYQAGGAYGFRDQLQDVMALAASDPGVAREHLLRSAARQFTEGDVQHWWHPPGGRGVRTRISDDLLWLPYVTGRYVEVTGDGAILDEIVPFLEGPTLGPGEPESYFEPRVSEERGTLFEHGARALDRSLATGAHGLPLMGTGDWNDGMNEVGRDGRGESVWLGWFLHAVLAEWAPIADARGEGKRAERWRGHADTLKDALEAAWDGAWYRRAYFDDGTPLGSAVNDACRIDSIAQSWSVISGAADPVRQARAMASLDEQLVRRQDGLVLLFTPPFDDTTLEPGYIKGYVPGVRENGGQYTHAAIWAIIAFAALGDGDRAAELFAMVNPLDRTRTAAAVARYRVEPYVVAADVYAVPPHVGRGGWTWYTGSAGWMYRAGLESILGFRLRGPRLSVDPCIPRAWRGFDVVLRHGSARYDIHVENPRGVSRGVASVDVDGLVLDGERSISLVDDGQTHRVRVVLG